MEKNKKIIISLIVLFFVLLSLTVSYSFSANIESDEIVVKSVTPVYDENSGVVLTENNEVIFSDKNQKVDYNVVIENISGSDLKIANTELTQPAEEFLKYELEGIKKDDVFKANETKELVVSLETVQMEGWGRN